MNEDSKRSLQPPFLSSKQALFHYTMKLLGEHDLRASKRFSQNFTIDPRYITTMLDSVDTLLLDQYIIEIGTGLGTLTLALSYRFVDRIILSIEKDRRLFQVAGKILGSRENIVMILADAVRLLPLLKTGTVVSSTPFSMTSPIILGIARNNSIRQAVLGVQKEVALRMTAEPGTKDYGRLTVITKLLFDTRITGFFPPSSFYPRPKVAASIIVLKRRREYQKKKHESLEKLTGCLFSSRNKKAAKIIVGCIEKLGGEPDKSVIESMFSDKRVRELAPGEIEWIVNTFLIAR